MKIIKTAAYQMLRPFDKEKYTPIPGLEGPITTQSGKVLYYDPKGKITPDQAPGMYFDRDADRYITLEEYEEYNTPRKNPFI